MLNTLLIILLAFGLVMGLKRGFILQLFHLIGFVISFLVAVSYYKPLGEQFSLWIPYPGTSNDSALGALLEALPLEQGFYNAIAFAVIFFAVKIILQIIATMLDFVAALPLLNIVNRLLGALLGLVEVYVITFIILFILALTPIEFTHTLIHDSSIAKWMIEHTPYLSEKIVELWFPVTGSE